MIKKFSFIMMLIAAFVFVGTAFAQEPPAHGSYQGGWGMNNTNWHVASGSFTSWGLYDPHPNGGGDSWIVDWSDPNNPVYIEYAPISLELWVEMYCLQTYHYTSYQWHRLGNAEEDISFIIEGTVQSNNGQYVSLTRKDQDLTHLYFQRSVLGGQSTDADDIPITWEGRWGAGLDYGVDEIQAWQTLTPSNGDLTLLINESCDHWFQFRGSFHLPYHIADGYYMLEMAGCPAPVM